MRYLKKWIWIRILWVWLALGLVLGLFGCTYVSGGGACDSGPLRLTVLDVGQGLAVLLEYDGRYAMFDMGPDSVGVMDTLAAHGVDTLEWVVLSHYHRDHCGGFMELETVPRVFVRRLYVGTDTAGGFIRDSVFRVARRFDIPVDTLVRGSAELWDAFGREPTTAAGGGAAIAAGAESAIAAGAESAIAAGAESVIAAGAEVAPHFEVMWPPSYVRVGENGASVVVRVEFGEASALLMGDLDSLGERLLLELSPTLSANVLQVGHHGSAGSSSLRFLSRVSPDYAVVSVGAHNRYGHPASGVIRKLGFVLGDSSRVYRTDADGSVPFELYGDLGVIVQFLKNL